MMKPGLKLQRKHCLDKTEKKTSAHGNKIIKTTTKKILLKKYSAILMFVTIMFLGVFCNKILANDFYNTKSPVCTNADSIGNTSEKIINNNPALNQDMVRLGINAYCYALKNSKTPLHNKNNLTLIDFTKPSYLKRLFVIDLKSFHLKLALNVAHGKNSGLTTATKFSNKPGSDETSLGVYTTGIIYYGKHGKSLRLNGLEKGINDNVLRRDVVMHCAPYMTDAFIKTMHRAGRSWGCFAVSPAICGYLVDLLKNGSVIFAYALPEEKDSNIET